MCKDKCGSKGIGSMIMWALLIIGGLNWGLVGIFNFDLVATIFGDMSIVSRIVYIVVAVSALGTLFGGCCCKKSTCCKNSVCAEGVCCMKDDAGSASCKDGKCDMHGSVGAKEDKGM